MEYVRISLMAPRRGQSHEATRLLAQIIAFCSQQRGFRGGLIVGGDPGAGRRIGRVTLWDSRAAAERVSATERMQALRSQLMLLAEEGTRVEHALDGVALSGEPGTEPGLSPRDAVLIAEGVVGGGARAAR